MPDWLSKAGDYAMRGLQTAADTASGMGEGLQYLFAPDPLQRLGNIEEAPRKVRERPAMNALAGGDPAQRRFMENVASGEAAIGDPLNLQAKAQITKERAATDGPKIGPRSFGMQVRDFLDSINPTPLNISAADLLGGVGTGVDDAKNPYDHADYDNLPMAGGVAGLTRLGTAGGERAANIAFRESINAANAKRAGEVLSPAANEAWSSFAKAYPRLSAHMSPAAWAEQEMAAGAKAAGRSRAAGAFRHQPMGVKIGQVQLNPSSGVDDALATLRHEGTHAARAVRTADRGGNWGTDYADTLAKVGYANHPEEIAANNAMRSAATRADKIAERDAMRQLEKLAGIR